MATKTEPKPAPIIEPIDNSGEELVEYTAPLGADPEHSQPIFAAVNGECIRIKRGATVKIKRKFLWVIQQGQEQELAAYRASEAVQAASKQAYANL